MPAPPVTVRRHSSEHGSWELANRAPHPAHAGSVLGYCGYAERSRGPVRRLEAPWRGVVLIISFGAPLRIRDATGESSRQVSFVGGLSDAPTYTEYVGEQHGIQVDLTPLAARAVLGLPMAELTNRVVGLEQLPRGLGAELQERLFDAGSWERRFAVLDEALARRLADAPPARPETAHAWELLSASGGLIPVAELQRRTGWSARHLARQFRAEVGLSPKAYARVLRFERAAAALSRDDGARLAEIALDCGYYDQAHMNREFREFAATTPAGYIGRLLPGGAGVGADEAEVGFVQDAGAAAA